jgi:hypothetical protein
LTHAQTANSFQAAVAVWGFILFVAVPYSFNRVVEIQREHRAPSIQRGKVSDLTREQSIEKAVLMGGGRPRLAPSRARATGERAAARI